MSEVLTDGAAEMPMATCGAGGRVELDDELVRQLAERARAGGLRLVGEGGLLSQLAKTVIEAGLEGEMDDHLGYAKHDPAGRDGANSRNGTRAKTILTEAGPIEIDVPRDRDSSFEPRLVAKRQRRLSGVDDLVISLSAKGHSGASRFSGGSGVS